MNIKKIRTRNSHLRTQIEALRFSGRRGYVMRCNSKDFTDFSSDRNLTELVNGDHDLTQQILDCFEGTTDITEINGYVYLVFDSRKQETIDDHGNKFIPYNLLLRIKAFLDAKQQKLN